MSSNRVFKRLRTRRERFLLSPALQPATSPDWPSRHLQQAYLNRLRPLLPIPAPASLGSRPRCLSKLDCENYRTSEDPKCFLFQSLVLTYERHRSYRFGGF
ncbi:hypothetical protein AVEN_123033-1 [Araneus ventricosus]|uniref:Uncharacterized protein n=1 Tax=Araneus ventricosus TaxID=182803 RepID=A0A4Y2KEP0_ARAVE|nr:hypothetical protein AVEN_123033-1 [Araneus ventricosus]